MSPEALEDAIEDRFPGNVTRLSTIVEILIILIQNFINKNPINCILLHKFLTFLLNFDHFHNFLHIFTKKNSTISKITLATLIAGPAVQPNTFVPLMLRKPDDRRQLTQRWRFTEDGKLMCTHRGLYVQAKDGFSGFHRGKTK